MSGRPKIQDIPNDKLGSEMARLAFELSDDEINAAQYVFWFSYVTERRIKELIVNIFLKHVDPKKPEYTDFIKDVLNSMTDEIMLHGKVQILKKEILSSLPRAKKLLDMLDQVKNLRNRVSHGDISSLEYGGKSLLSREVQESLYKDFYKALDEAKQ